MTKAHKQRGAALLIVLLLAATLSFIALASLEKTSLAAARTANVQSRSEALWRGFAAEALAGAAIEAAYKANDGKLSLDDSWATEPLIVPFDEGGARIFFIDAALCFNLNSLRKQPSTPGQASPTVAEFARLAELVGFSEFEAVTLAEAIADWMDDDNFRRPQGAEDEYYTTLPSPYRTGNQPVASVSEIRAIRGVNRTIYGTLKPYLCAGADDEPSSINVNMMSERHAPVLAAMLGDDVTLQTAADIIAARPVGGYPDKAAFLANPQLAGLNLPDGVSDRFKTTTTRLTARAEILYHTALLEVTTEFAVSDNGETSVLARRIGAEE